MISTVRVRFVRESAPNNMLCVCRRHLSERQRIIGATVDAFRAATAEPTDGGAP